MGSRDASFERVPRWGEILAFRYLPIQRSPGKREKELAYFFNFRNIE